MKIKMILFLLLFIFFILIFISSSNNAKTLRYDNNTLLKNVDASFRGLDKENFVGDGVVEVGDVNGDGYCDFLLSSMPSNKAYLFFGKPNDWKMNSSISNANIIITGENKGDLFGLDVEWVGDVNSDGYDDFLIGAQNNNGGELRAGKTYLFLGGTYLNKIKSLNAASANASFIGEYEDAYSGGRIAGLGDVNGDGFNDFLIGSQSESDYRGKSYLFFGKKLGWSQNTLLSNSDASFIGNESDNAKFVARAGDINGDGYDDLLIGAPHSDQGGEGAGKVYLMYGKPAGWVRDFSLVKSDASFYGQDNNSLAGTRIDGAFDFNNDSYDDFLIQSYHGVFFIFGRPGKFGLDTKLNNSDVVFVAYKPVNQFTEVAGLGDVNGDGFDDILIGSGFPNPGEHPVQSFLILGRQSGLMGDVKILNVADAIFNDDIVINEGRHVISGAFDVNGDGFPDLLISESGLDPRIDNAGETFLIFPEFNFRPSLISSIELYNDSEYLNKKSFAYMNDTIYIELKGVDSNPSHIDSATVTVTSSMSSQNGFYMNLIETKSNSSIYRGEISVKNFTKSRQHWIKARPIENIIISDYKNSKINITIPVIGKVNIKPDIDITYINEDENYHMHYWAENSIISKWTFESNATWLKWDQNDQTLFGIPNNENVESYGPIPVF